jgi:hypothetical protein
MARNKPLTLTDIVPDTQFPVVALCRVAQRPVFYVKVGDILARDGAWDHKYVVTEVHSVLDQEFNSYVHDVGYIEPGLLFRVTVRNLGRFFADNRFKAASRYSDKQITIRLGMESGGQMSDSKLRLVQPIGELLAPTLLDERYQQISHIMELYEHAWSYLWTFRGQQVESVIRKGNAGPEVPAVPKLKVAKVPAELGAHQIAAVPVGHKLPEQPPLPPEAILAHFAL